MTVTLELPGVKKTDLTMSLGTCPYSRVKQITVRGRSGPLFTDEGYTVRERKYGEFKRILVVPPDTKVRNFSLLHLSLRPLLASSFMHVLRPRIALERRVLYAIGTLTPPEV